MTGAEFKKLKAFIRLLRSYCHFPDCPNIRYYPLHEPCTHKLDLNTSISWEVANLLQNALSEKSPLQEIFPIVKFAHSVVRNHLSKYQDLYHILSELLDFLKQTKGGAS